MTALRLRGVLYRFARQTSLFVAVTLLSASGSLLPSVTAGALSQTSYKQQSFSEGWTPFDHDPSGGYSVETYGGRDNTFTIDVDTNAVTTPRTEGVQRTIASSDAVKANIYIDNDWQVEQKDIRIGFNVKGKNLSGGVSNSVGVEFIRSSGFTGWRAGSDMIGWTNITAGYTVDAWNEIELAVNDTRGVDVYVGGAHTTTNDSQQMTDLDTVILTNYNFGTANNNYDAHWDALMAGRHDSTSPTISFLTPSFNGEMLNSDRYVSVMATDETVLRQVGITIYDNDNEVVRENAPYVAGTDCRLDVSLAGLADGESRIETFAVDNAGNRSQSITREFVIDSTAPQVEITAPLSDTASGTIVIDGTAADSHLHHYYFAVKNSDGNVVAGPGTVTDTHVSSWEWGTTTIPDGIYTIILTAEDAAGNQTQATKEITVDNTAPVVSLDPIDGTVSSGRTMTIRGAIDDMDASVILQVDGKEYAVTDKRDGRWSHEFINGLSAGEHSIKVIAVDAFGNYSSIVTSPASYRDITVAAPSFIPGAGAGVLETKPLIDTAQLFQTPTTVSSQPVPNATTPVGAGSDVVALRQNSDAPVAAIESPSVVLEPTENGWKLLGVLWYWWVFCVALVTSVGWYAVNRWWNRPKAEAITD